ncbi:hypothetical protein [Janthinobacterium sp. AD80]|nr:hypothetical protein [Janthinobacterium sp. AD80]
MHATVPTAASKAQALRSEKHKKTAKKIFLRSTLLERTSPIILF